MSGISILKAVKQRFIAQEATAIATLEMFINDSVGVADHSNVVGEVEKQIKLLTEARECLATLDSTMTKSDDVTSEEKAGN